MDKQEVCKPGVWYGFPKPALVPANDVIFLATPCLSKDCVNSETWSRSRLSASQHRFSDYGPRLRYSPPQGGIYGAAQGGEID